MKEDFKMDLEYVKRGDYYLPNLELQNKNKRVNLGKYGRLRESYLKEHKTGLFNHLVMKEEIIDHLAEVDEQARSYLETLIKQLAKEENVTENLKATNQLEWVQKMNNIKNRAEEIVLNELIYN